MPLFSKNNDKACEVDISIASVLLIFAFAALSGLPLMWALIRYWLFAP